MDWVSERDEGQAAAINAGLRRATGDILSYLNSDDLYFPGAFQRVVDAFASDPAADFVYGDGDVIDEAGARQWEWLSRPYDHAVMTSYHFLWNDFTNYIMQQATFWRRRVRERIGDFDPTFHFAMDAEYWIRAGAAGLRLHAPAREARQVPDDRGHEVAVEPHRLLGGLPGDLPAAIGRRDAGRLLRLLLLQSRPPVRRRPARGPSRRERGCSSGGGTSRSTSAPPSTATRGAARPWRACCSPATCSAPGARGGRVPCSARRWPSGPAGLASRRRRRAAPPGLGRPRRGGPRSLGGPRRSGATGWRASTTGTRVATETMASDRRAPPSRSSSRRAAARRCSWTAWRAFCGTTSRTSRSSSSTRTASGPCRRSSPAASRARPARLPRPGRGDPQPGAQPRDPARARRHPRLLATTTSRWSRAGSAPTSRPSTPAAGSRSWWAAVSIPSGSPRSPDWLPASKEYLLGIYNQHDGLDPDARARSAHRSQLRRPPEGHGRRRPLRRAARAPATRASAA